VDEALAGLAVPQVELLVAEHPGTGARELPGFQQDLAFAADAFAAAGGIDMDPGQEGGPQQILPVRHLDRNLVWLERDLLTQDAILFGDEMS
jgi:hypothetical protein